MNRSIPFAPRWISKSLVYTILGLMGILYFYPFIWMISSSLKSGSEFFDNGLRLLPNKLSWSNYPSAWEMANFSTYFKNSIFITLSVTILVILLTSLAGYALARSSFPGKNIVLGLIILTLFLPKGYTIIPIFQLVKDLGLLNSLWGVILVNTATSMVFNTFLFIAYFLTLPRELEESAKMDGAGVLTTYWRIAMPFAKPIIATVAVFEFIDNWNSFFIPLVFTLGKPELRTVSVGMYAFIGQHVTDWTLMCAAAVISLLPTVLLFFFMQRFFEEGLTGAIRG